MDWIKGGFFQTRSPPLMRSGRLGLSTSRECREWVTVFPGIRSGMQFFPLGGSIHCLSLCLSAGGALESPALLLRSRLGNRHVGRGLRLHPSPFLGASFAEPVEAWRGLPQSVLIDQFAEFMEDGHGGFLIWRRRAGLGWAACCFREAVPPIAASCASSSDRLGRGPGS
jgi:hypothetical protein